MGLTMLRLLPLVLMGALMSPLALGADSPAEIAKLARQFGVAAIANPEEVRAAAYASAAKLRAEGLKSFAGINLDELWQRFQKIEVKAFTKINVMSSEGRTGSVYLTSEGIVVINYPELQLLDEPQKQMLLMHEFLGAAGYRDDNYEFSALFAATYWANPRPSFFDKKLDAHLSRLAKDRRRLTKTEGTAVAREGGGGISGVGGGGDGVAIDIKKALLHASEILFEPGQDDEVLAQQLKTLKLRIETDHSFGALDALRMETDPRTTEKYVVIPRNLWRDENMRPKVMAKLLVMIQKEQI